MKKIKISGMSCNHCVMAVTRALNGIEGIRDVLVDLKTGEATFEETIPVDPEIIRKRISEAGYEVVG
ncbi:MAG: Copper chaperone CopZ [Syntrophaceae bacterium PtaB.Bin095]|nr:MAG: Copper chaperone CopZ [Syntrophaceae bacterium PtaB.Bin095]